MASPPPPNPGSGGSSGPHNFDAPPLETCSTPSNRRGLTSPRTPLPESPPPRQTPAPAHRQSEALLENGRGVGVRQSQRFVHQHSQRHRLRSHLYRRRPKGIGGLQRVATLYSLVALRAPADRNLKPPHPRAAHNLFLVLRFHPFHYQRPAAGRALRGRRYGNLFVYLIWDWPLVVRAMGRTLEI